MSLELTLEALKKRENLIPYGILSKTLAYINHFPRGDRENYSRDKFGAKIANKISSKLQKEEILFSEGKSLGNEKEREVSALLLDTTIYLEDEGSFLGLDSIGEIRRHLPFFIIQKDIFLGKYQILEAAIFGSDAVILDGELLNQKELKELIEASKNFGLFDFIECKGASSLKKAIFSGASGIYIDDYSKMGDILPMIPNSKIVATTIKREHLKDIMGSQFEHGVDIFFVD